MNKIKIENTISLIITTYNNPAFLEIVLKSVLRQKVFPLEVIIADDGSGEETGFLIKKYQAIFPISLIHSWIEDKGFRVAKSRNAAIAKTQGSYIIIIDGDMVVTPSFIKDHKALRKKGQFVTGSRARLNKKATDNRIKTLNPVFSFFSNGLSRRLVMFRVPGLHSFIKGRSGLSNARSCHMAFWKEDFIQVNGFEENFEGWGYEDSEFVQRLFNIGLIRKNAKLMSPAIHLYHTEKEDDQALINKKRLEKTITEKKTKAEIGIDQYLVDDTKNSNINLSIIILNYNTASLTLRCIDTIHEFPPSESYEVIVVDNHSKPDDFGLLEQNIEKRDFTLFRTDFNCGFGVGNMAGAHLAKGKYLCFINSDVELMEDCMTPLCKFLEENPDVGCVTPQQYNKNKKPVPSFNHPPGIRHEILGKKFLETFFQKKYPKRKGIVYDNPFSAAQINGVFMLFPRKVFFEIGGFDTNIFLFYEEIDVCLRLHAHNFKSMVIPQYKFLHLHGESTKQLQSHIQKELYISKLYTYKKHRLPLLYFFYKWINFLKLCAKPKRWHILPIFFINDVLTHSMRDKVK